MNDVCTDYIQMRTNAVQTLMDVNITALTSKGISTVGAKPDIIWTAQTENHARVSNIHLQFA